MALVCFLRGVNVGGRRALRPAALARELSAYDVVNVGAAGTFVVRGKVTRTALREEILRRLPFEAEVVICSGRDVAELAAAAPFPREASAKDVRRFVSVVARRPRTAPRLPLARPTPQRWQVKVVALRGRFALSLWRKRGKTLLYPNAVVEKELGVAATTRNWETITKIHARLG